MNFILLPARSPVDNCNSAQDNTVLRFNML